VCHLHLPKEAGQPLVANRLSVEGVPRASLDLSQSVAEHPFETVTLVLDPRAPLVSVHLSSS
jgi:hypothetical protein